MKSVAFLLVTLVVGSLASPTVISSFENERAQLARNERIVTGQIVDAINNVAEQIREAGLDPFELDGKASYELPVPIILSVEGIVDSLNFNGLSNIVIDSINFSILQSRLTFNIQLPGISLSIGDAQASVVLLGDNYEASASGSLRINTIRLIGDVRVNVGIISGISIRSLSLRFSLGGIQSNLNINILGLDLSSRINTSLGTNIPAKITEFENEINKLIEIIAYDLINNALESVLL